MEFSWDDKKAGVGVRRRFLSQYRKGHNLALLKPEVAAAFPTDDAVNDALMSLVRIAQGARRPTGAQPDARKSRAPVSFALGVIPLRRGVGLLSGICREIVGTSTSAP